MTSWCWTQTLPDPSPREYQALLASTALLGLQRVIHAYNRREAPVTTVAGEGVSLPYLHLRPNVAFYTLLSSKASYSSMNAAAELQPAADPQPAAPQPAAPLQPAAPPQYDIPRQNLPPANAPQEDRNIVRSPSCDIPTSYSHMPFLCQDERVREEDDDYTRGVKSLLSAALYAITNGVGIAVFCAIMHLAVSFEPGLVCWRLMHSLVDHDRPISISSYPRSSQNGHIHSSRRVGCGLGGVDARSRCTSYLTLRPFILKLTETPHEQLFGATWASFEARSHLVRHYYLSTLACLTERDQHRRLCSIPLPPTSPRSIRPSKTIVLLLQ